LEFRRELSYPPFATLVNVLSKNESDSAAAGALDALVVGIKKLPMAARRGVELIGPTPAVLAKLKGEYRWHMVLRSEDRDAAIGLLRAVFEANPGLRRKLAVDVDPMSMI
jgi:primosomal protein N' (replication factor Y) (superfamily II helicase)